MIRVAFLDDHPAVRAGLEAILATAPDLRLVGSAAGEHELWPLLERTNPAVVILDLQDRATQSRRPRFDRTSAVQERRSAEIEHDSSAGHADATVIELQDQKPATTRPAARSACNR